MGGCECRWALLKANWTGSLVVVRLLRRWVAAWEAGENPLPNLLRLAADLGICPELAVGLASLFQLTESCLGRNVQTECCCSLAIGPDERAILLIIAAVPKPGLPLTSGDIPHGLPAALSWAVTSVRRSLREDTNQLFRLAPRRPLKGSDPMPSRLTALRGFEDATDLQVRELR